jgi:hypothetical protein
LFFAGLGNGPSLANHQTQLEGVDDEELLRLLSLSIYSLVKNTFIYRYRPCCFVP